MYDFDLDFEEYYEPSAMDEIIMDAKNKLREKVKEEVKTYYDSIIRENGVLKLKNEKLQKIVNEIESKENELEREKRQMLQTVRRERLSELMKNFEVVLYQPEAKSIPLPKCNKCDNERRIPYKTPLGKEQFEYCDCNNHSHYFYSPYAYYASEFRVNSGYDKKEIVAWYKHAPSYGNKDDDTYSYSNSTFLKRLIEEDFTDFENIDNRRETFFRSIETCQKYCDYLNSKEGW